MSRDPGFPVHLPLFTQGPKTEARWVVITRIETKQDRYMRDLGKLGSVVGRRSGGYWLESVNLREWPEKESGWPEEDRIRRREAESWRKRGGREMGIHDGFCLVVVCGSLPSQLRRRKQRHAPFFLCIQTLFPLFNAYFVTNCSSLHPHLVKIISKMKHLSKVSFFQFITT